uniref:Basic leucine zipper domain containing protein n=1 Tax=Papaver somniferum TaxID=3469 RepID=A0A5B7LJS4_PAPSO|nr:basic leucine zipper domain containing protein [Papaver somniferum]
MMEDEEDFMDDESLNSFFADIFNDALACTHTHFCNPPAGPDLSHSHSCFHLHTKILPDEPKTTTEVKRPGNRDAVRKYRQKKKARAESLEDEVKKLRIINQQLINKLQGKAALEQEVARLRSVLTNIKGRIKDEIGSFPYPKSIDCNNGVSQNTSSSNSDEAYDVSQCKRDLQCGDQVQCLYPELDDNCVGEAYGNGLHIEGFRPCDLGYVPCAGIKDGSTPPAKKRKERLQTNARDN